MDFAVILLLAFGGVTCALAIYGRKVNILFLLTGLFLILSPLSGSVSLKLASMMKWARVFTTIAIVLLGVVRFGITRFGPAVWSVMPFMFLDFVSPTWGYFAFYGILHKGIFALTFSAGIMLAYSLHDREGLVRGIRFLAIVAAIGAVVTLIFARPALGFQAERLDPLEMNPNRIAGNCASLLLLCSYLALYEHSKPWRAFGWLSCCLLAAIIALTGSRSAAAVAVVGFLAQAVPLASRPGRLAIAACIAAVLFFVGASYLGDTAGGSRLFSLANTRAIQWEGNWQVFTRAPVFGFGWIFSADMRRSNMHSMYFQIACEMGFVGIAVFLVCGLLVIMTAARNYRFLRQHRAFSDVLLLPPCLIIGALVLGLGESSPLMGSTPDTLLWGFGIGLIDQLPRLLLRERQRYLSLNRPRPSGRVV